MSKAEQLLIRITETQIDRTSGHVVPAGTLGEVLGFVANPSERSGGHCAKVEFAAFKLDTEPLKTENHVFYVPLNHLVLEDPRSPIV
jgi:hypothetical protein